jgi:hypothetical protein
MINFESAKSRVENDYKNKIKTLKYWEKIYKNMQKYKEKGIEEFSMEFKHDVKDITIPDNESKIETYAKDLGYEIVDEKLGSNISVYTFRLKEE